VRGGRALLLALATVMPLGAAGQVYKWVDSQGKTQYGDKPPDEAKSQSLKIESTSGAVGLAEANVEVAETEIEWFRVAGLTLPELNASKEANGPFNDIVESKVWGPDRLAHPLEVQPRPLEGRLPHRHVHRDRDLEDVAA